MTPEHQDEFDALAPWRPPRPVRLALLTAVYLAGAMLASLYLRTPQDIALFWPSAGVGFAAVVVYGLRWAVIVPLSMLLFHLLVQPVPPAFLPWSILSNTVATLIGGAYVLHERRALAPGTADGLLMLRGGLLLALVSALLGTCGLALAGMVPWSDFSGTWVLWMFGDLLGVTAMGPVMVYLLVADTRDPAPTPRLARERGLWLLLLGLAFVLQYALARDGNPYVLALISLPLSLLLWAALRFSARWTAVATLLVVTVLSLSTGLGLGGLAPPPSSSDAALLMLLLVLFSVIPNLVAASRLDGQRSAASFQRRFNADRLTGLPNRASFHEQARRLLAGETPELHLLYLDLDNLRVVNDAASHSAGDHVIALAGKCLAEALPPGALLARTGGDEFCAMLACGEASAHDIARYALTRIGAMQPDWQGQALSVNASIGLVGSRYPHVAFDTLLSQADAACAIAKEHGGHRVHMLRHHDDEVHTRHASMRTAMRLREAMQSRELALYCQPIVALDGGWRQRQFELLLRWQAPDGSIRPVAELVGAAERFRLGSQLDRHVLDDVLQWYEHHPQTAELATCSLNIGGASLIDEQFIGYLVRRLRDSVLRPHRLCIEITETSVVRDRKRAGRVIAELRELGCRFALDDFGTGFCSFGYLRELDVDYLKIDGSFIRDLEHSPLAHAVVRSITDIAHVLRKRSVAEQVESEAQMRIVQAMGVDFAQGHAVARPQPIDDYFRTLSA